MRIRKTIKKIKNKMEGNGASRFDVWLGLLLLSFPIHVQSLPLKGDFRFRIQWERENSDAERVRERIRFRIGAVKHVDNVWELGFGLATGGANPRSTNETLERAFETPDIRLDYAYAEWMARNGLSIWFGKYKGIKKALWLTSDLLWDSDIRPDGVGVKFNMGYGSPDIFANAGLFVLDEIKSNPHDPLMGYAQMGIKSCLSSDVKFYAGVAYYIPQNVKGYHLKHSSGTNTTDPLGNLIYNYQALAPSLKLSFGKFSIYSDFVYNPYVSHANKGYLIGGSFSDKTSVGHFKVKYQFRRLEKDAWLDPFPDSDAYGGGTGVVGHEIELKLGLTKHASFAIDFYTMKKLESNDHQNLIQFDLSWKF